MRTFALITLLAAALAGCEPVAPAPEWDAGVTTPAPEWETETLLEVSRVYGVSPHDQLPLDVVVVRCTLPDGELVQEIELADGEPNAVATVLLPEIGECEEGSIWVRGGYRLGEQLTMYTYGDTFDHVDRLSPFPALFPVDAVRPSNSDCEFEQACDGYQSLLVPLPVEECGHWSQGDEMLWSEAWGASYRTEWDDYYSRSDCP